MGVICLGISLISVPAAVITGGVLVFVLGFAVWGSGLPD
jgi:hypothetical protein